MKKTQKTKKTESGRSMIEMVGVLAVMGLITATAFILISSAMNNQRMSRANDDVSAIVSGVRTMYATSPDFSNLDVNALELLGYSDVKSPYGGKYTLAKVTGFPDYISISFATSKASICTAVLSGLSGIAGYTEKVDANKSRCDGEKLTVYFNKAGASAN